MTHNNCVVDGVSPSQVESERAAIRPSDSIEIPTKPDETYCIIRKTSNAVGIKIMTEVNRAEEIASNKIDDPGIGSPK